MIGQRLSHYQIVEQIGAGGMGVVYRAHDEQLERDVAIKVLPKGSLAAENARKRFRKEALSLARLNHPNIATVHEFGTDGGTDFLVTEYIAGITLDAKLARGALPANEVFRLGTQLADGLAAAHKQGIVHRDLKPGNLRVTADGRLKILDFGLAQLAPHPSDLGVTATLTHSQDGTGTLPYMAPEQLRGEVADARSDLWSAGAVLYEMATGRRPFLPTAPALLINAIVNQPCDPPARVNPGVPVGLSEVILKALTKDPAQRYQSAGDLAVDLQRGFTPSSPGFVVPRRPARRSLTIGIALLLLALASGGYLFLRRSARPAATAPKRRRSVAVLGFKNLSGNPDKSWLSTALAEMMTTELSQGDQLRTIPGESVAHTKISLSLSDTDSFSPETLTRIRQNLGSDAVVLGSYLPLGNGLMRLDVRLQDALAGETLASISEKGSESEIDALVSKAGAELRGKLGAPALSDAQSALVRASLPSNSEAARLYSEGLQRLRIFEALAARDSLDKAITIDPNHAPTHSALAEAFSTLGYEAKAKEQAQRALELSGSFSREERFLIEGRAHELLAETAQAIESYRALWEFFPDNIDYGLFLIRAQIAAGRGKDAEGTVVELRKLNVSEADAARVDLAEAQTAHASSDFKRQQLLAERATARGKAIGATLLVAQALQVDAEASERMGQSDRTIQLSNQAREIYVSAGDRRGAARTQLMVGDLLFDQGDYEGAKKQFEAALPVFREIGAERSVSSTLARIGNVFYDEGKLRESETYYRQVLQRDQALNDAVSLAGDYGNLANALDGLGSLEESLKMQQLSLNAFKATGDRRGVAATLNNLGNQYIEMGNLSQAKTHFEQSLAVSREIAFRRGEPYPIAGLGDVFFAQGDLQNARKQYEQALALCKELNAEDFAAQTGISLASIALLEKRFADGEALAMQSAAAYEKANSPGNNAWAEALLARNLLGAGNLSGSRHAAEKAVSLSKQTPGQTPRYEAALADARVKARSGKSAEARQELESALSSTRKFGYRLYELQARLALAEIELGSDSASARAHLNELEKDAKAQGVLLIANQAHVLLSTR